MVVDEELELLLEAEEDDDEALRLIDEVEVACLVSDEMRSSGARLLFDDEDEAERLRPEDDEELEGGSLKVLAGDELAAPENEAVSGAPIVEPECRPASRVVRQSACREMVYQRGQS